MKSIKRIKQLIKKSSNVFIMGHKNLDLDAIGSSLGMYKIATYYNKKAYIIVDELEHESGVKKIIDELDSNIIIKSTDVNNYFKSNSLLIICDTNKVHLLQNEKIINDFNNIIVIDHHEETDQSIVGTLNYIDSNKSSASEMVTDILLKLKIEIESKYATYILAGIILDTNNFTLRTDANTYYSSYYLTYLGAIPKKVQYYLKEDLKDYIIRHKVIVNAKVLDNKYIISKADNNKKYKREDLAKMADILLNFNNVKASFIIGNRIDEGVSISARSDGSIDVGLILERLGGGGNKNNAACHLLNTNIEDLYLELIKLLKEE